MKRLIVATRNKGKVKEFAEIFRDIPVEIISMQDAGLDIEVEETGSTFEENALLKAREIARISGEAVIADDSGLEVDSLDGAPGIYSARFAGEGASASDRNIKLLKLLEDVPEEKRTARFVCAVAFVTPDGRDHTVRGTCEGRIAFKPEGNNGFGYDPLFYLPEFNQTMAQIAPEIKNRISHRGKALRLIFDVIQKTCS